MNAEELKALLVEHLTMNLEYDRDGSVKEHHRIVLRFDGVEIDRVYLDE